jgi:hypothetical protein
MRIVVGRAGYDRTVTTTASDLDLRPLSARWPAALD